MDERVYTEIERLRSLRIQGLRARYREVFGEDSRTAHKQHLVRRIAWRLQVQAQGDLSERARQRALEIANDADLKTQVPRHWEGPGPTAQNPPQGRHAGRIPPAGTLLRRVYGPLAIVVSPLITAKSDGPLFLANMTISRHPPRSRKSRRLRLRSSRSFR
jgi:hypothetical protein